MELFIADESFHRFAEHICDTIQDAAQKRGTGIARRSPEYIKTKMTTGNAVIALDGDTFAGFCYIEVWGGKNFVAHSGLIIVEEYRGRGLAKAIKSKVLDLSIHKYPKAKIFGITTGSAVMKINYQLGYKPVTFNELTDDPKFWDGCQTCLNYDILTRTNRKMCLCTGMLYDNHLNQKINIDEK